MDMLSRLTSWSWRQPFADQDELILDFRQTQFIEPWAIAMFISHALHLQETLKLPITLLLEEDNPANLYLKNGEPTRTEQMRLTLLEMGIEDGVLARKLSDAYGEYRDANLKLFPESLLVLNTLRDRGYPMGLMTNGPADIQRQEIATCGIESYFKTIQIEGEMGYGKPNLDCFRIAEKNHGFAPNEMLMVGNSYGHDIKAAHLAGWKTAWVRRDTDVAPSATKPEEKPDDGIIPDWIGSDLTELLDLLQG